MNYLSFFLSIAVLTEVCGYSDAYRQPIGDREQIRQPIGETSPRPEIRQPIGDRELPVTSGYRQPIGEKDAPEVYRQPIGEREQIRQPIGERAPRPNIRPQIGERELPVTSGYRQPIGEREISERTIRPATTATFSVQTTQRPTIVLRQLPRTVIIDQRSASYASAALTPHLISRKGDLVALEDGSSWKVRHKDRKSVKRWSPNDVIVIETGQILIWSVYKLVNYSRDESIDVELIEPIKNGILSHWVTEVRPFDGFVRLNDGSVWKMSPHELARWSAGDDVIIAMNKDWFSGRYSYVLINPRVKTRLLAVFEASFG